MFDKKKETVRMHLEGLNESIDGLLISSKGDHYTLFNAQMVSANQLTDLGMVAVPKSKVLFYQIDD